MDNLALIDRAAGVLRRHTTREGRLFGDVGAALVTASGAVHVGVCVDTPGWGLCAERSAIAAMVSAGEYRIARIVAVWRSEETGQLHVLPPCGICRQFMRDVDGANLDTEVVLGPDHATPLGALLPQHDWPVVPEPAGMRGKR